MKFTVTLLTLMIHETSAEKGWGSGGGEKNKIQNCVLNVTILDYFNLCN